MPIKKIIAIWSVVSCLICVAPTQVHAQDATPTPAANAAEQAIFGDLPTLTTALPDGLPDSLGKPIESIRRYALTVAGLPAFANFIFSENSGRLIAVFIEPAYTRPSGDYTQDWAALRAMLTRYFDQWARETESERTWETDLATITLVAKSGWLIEVIVNN